MIRETFRREVYVSTNSFTSRHLDQILALCCRYRLTALELSEVQSYDLALLGSNDYPRHYLVHNYFPPPQKPFLLNLASQNEENLGVSRAHCRAAIDLSVQLAGDLYAAHGGFATDLSPDKLGNPLQQAALPADSFASYERTYATLFESVKCLTDYAKERGVRFLIENNGLSSLGGKTGRKILPMLEAKELLRLTEDIHDPNFGLLVDVGHLNVSARALGFDRHQFIDILAPHVVAFHLSDNDGVSDQHLPFSDSAWFLPRLRDFPNATIVIELSNLEIDQIVVVRDIVEEWL